MYFKKFDFKFEIFRERKKKNPLPLLLLQKADLAIADLTITYEREQAVDFTMPFMNLGKKLIFFSVNILWPLFFAT